LEVLIDGLSTGAYTAAKAWDFQAEKQMILPKAFHDEQRQESRACSRIHNWFSPESSIPPAMIA
jgi:hypothetical protein